VGISIDRVPEEVPDHGRLLRPSLFSTVDLIYGRSPTELRGFTNISSRVCCPHLESMSLGRESSVGLTALAGSKIGIVEFALEGALFF
jgi:hypothetical protein